MVGLAVVVLATGGIGELWDLIRAAIIPILIFGFFVLAQIVKAISTRSETTDRKRLRAIRERVKRGQLPDVERRPPPLHSPPQPAAVQRPAPPPPPTRQAPAPASTRPRPIPVPPPLPRQQPQPTRPPPVPTQAPKKPKRRKRTLTDDQRRVLQLRREAQQRKQATRQAVATTTKGVSVRSLLKGRNLRQVIAAREILGKPIALRPPDTNL